LFFPPLLERRRREGPVAVRMIVEACLQGTRPGRAGDPVVALGADSGIPRSDISWVCADLDTEVAAFRDRILTPIVFLYVFPGAAAAGLPRPINVGPCWPRSTLLAQPDSSLTRSREWAAPIERGATQIVT
jgi:hypothetical protein